MELTLVNGRPADQVAVSERALHYGDGLFETISCRLGRPRWLALHWQRLQAGCRRLQLPFEDFQSLTDEVTQLAAGTSECIIKVIVSRGAAKQRGYRPSGQETPTRIVSRHPWPVESDAGRPLRVALSSVRLGINPLLAGLKHLNRLEQVLAQQARPEGIDEVLMLSSAGELVGGSMSNVFLVNEAGLFTPAVHQCGVAGVMRRLLLEIADSSRTDRACQIIIRPVSADELAGVSEAFVTNVRWGIRSIARLDGRELAGEDRARRLRTVLDAQGG